MKKIFFFFFLSFIFIGCNSSNTSYKKDNNTHFIKVFFSKTSGDYINGVDEIIIKDINLAKKSIELAIYEITNDKIINALLNASKRGVKVKIIVDDEFLNNQKIKDLNKTGILITGDNSKYTMHNKYMIIDGKIVWSGSGNYTYYAFYRNYENFVRIEDLKIADVYKKDFQMILDKNVSYLALNSSFKVYFSPNDNIKSILINKINSASKRIYFLMYAFTDYDLAEAIIKAKKRGVDVKGVMDGDFYDNKYSVYSYLINNNIDVKLDSIPGKLHDKVLIVDDFVYTGSYNFTKSANEKNYENLIGYDKIVYYYESEFWKIFKNSQ